MNNIEWIIQSNAKGVVTIIMLHCLFLVIAIIFSELNNVIISIKIIEEFFRNYSVVSEIITLKFEIVDANFSAS